MNGDIWCIIPASGYSRRMGSPKLLLPIGGESMIRSVARTALAAMASTAVVHRRDDPALPAQLAGLPLHFVAHAEANAGLSAAIRAGIAFVSARQAQAAVIVLGDMPGIDADVLRHVQAVYRATGSRIVQARYADRPGHPVLFDRSLFPELLELTGDQGAKPVVERYAGDIRKVAVAAPQPADLDTPAEYERYVRSLAD
jgi:molybdenum cofactor cytidylyltransferase